MVGALRVSADPPLASLPVVLTRFIGREQELAALEEAVSSGRLLTLAGPGGCGKTRLALETASTQACHFPDGAYWVDLAGVTDPALVSQAAATVLGVYETAQRSILETLTGFLRSKELLRVLDNCEHLLTGCASLASILLTACPRVKIIATSREPLNLAGETIWRVPPLSLPAPDTMPNGAGSLLEYDAISLFVERASSVQRQFALTSENAAAVFRICSRLDGLPLAIELAGVRVKVLTVEQILERLDDRFALLTSGQRVGALPRHQTLRAAIDWSYALLSSAEQALLRRLSTFAGNFALEAAESICAFGELRPAETLDLLSALADKSMLAADTAGQREARYRLLETIREYARGQSEPEEWQQTRDRHLDYYCRLAEVAEEKLKGPEQLAWLERLDAELGNIRAALEWSIDGRQTRQTKRIEKGLRVACALYRFWEARGYWTEGRKWIEDALALEQAAAEPPDSAEGPDSDDAKRYRVKALCTVGLLVFFKRDFPAAIDWFEKGLALAQEIGDARWTAMCLTSLASVHIFDGTLAAQRPALEEAVALARTTGDRWLIALCLTNLAHSVRLVDNQAALPVMEESIRLARETGDKVLLTEALFVATNAAYGRLDLLAAEKLAREFLEVSRATGRKHSTAMALYLLGGVRFAQGGRPSDLAMLLKEGLTLAAERDERTLISLGLVGVGMFFSGAGRGRQAAEMFGAAYRVLDTIGIDARRWAGPGTSMKEYKGYLERARSQIGEVAFNQAFQAGHALSVEQAVERGLAVASELEAALLVVAPHSTGLIIRGLGPAEVFVEGRRLTSSDWVYTRAEELFFYLLYYGGRTREQIGLDLYPDASPEQLRRNLGVVLHHLRRALGRSDWVVFEKGHYFFNRTLAPGYWFDVEAFETEVAEAHRQQETAPEQAVIHLRSAIRIYRGDLFEDLHAGDWHVVRREEMHRKYLDALVLLGQLLYAQAQYAEAAQAFQQAIHSDPFMEAAHRGLMCCHARQSERSQALRHYHSLSALLRDELGAEPSPETTEVFQRLTLGEQI